MNNPDSPFAHALHARALWEHAKSYRGDSWARDVTDAGWAGHNDYMRQAIAYLREHAAVALKDSYGHMMAIKAAQALGVEHAQLATIAEQGLILNPDDFSLYEEVAVTLVPKWGGDAATLDKYIRHATEATRARHGWRLYAQLYAQAEENEYDINLFKRSHAKWADMQRGFEDILARHPDAHWYRNRYAYLACIADDMPTLARVLEQLGSASQTDAWGQNPERKLDECRDRAEAS